MFWRFASGPSVTNATQPAGRLVPSSRQNQGNNRDWVGVRVVFEYRWISRFLRLSECVTWTDDAVMRMEPNFDF